MVAVRARTLLNDAPRTRLVFDGRSRQGRVTMPGVPHETMVMLLREHPEWLRSLVAVVAQRTLPEALLPVDSAVRLVDPAEVRLDLVLAPADGASWVLVEVQLEEDEAKARK